jgi:putative MATE family efflux protein
VHGRPDVRDLTSGSISRNLWYLAIPMMATNMLQTVFNVVDMIFVGRLGPSAIAAVSVCGAIMMLPFALLIGIATATVATVSRFFGAQDYDGAGMAAIQSLLMGAVGGIAILILGVLFAPELLRLFGVQSDVHTLGTVYLRIIFFAAASFSIQFLSAAVLQAVGDARTSLWIMASSVLLNIALDPLLIFGIGPFPRWEVAGAAWATSIARTVGMAVALVILFRKKTHLQLHLRNVHFDGSLIRRMLKIGIPGSLQMGSRSIAGMIMMGIVAQYGTFALATYGIGIRLDMFVMMPGFGLAAATATLVGQNLGAGEKQRAEKSGWIAAGNYVAFMLSAGVLFYIFAETVFSIFNNQAEVLQLGKVYLRIVVFAYPFIAIGIILNRALSGAGETTKTMIVTVISLFAVGIPLACILPQLFNLATKGLWLSIVISNINNGVIMTIIFSRGRWKEKKI